MASGLNMPMMGWLLWLVWWDDQSLKLGFE